jgi:hypothetical protein
MYLCGRPTLADRAVPWLTRFFVARAGSMVAVARYLPGSVVRLGHLRRMLSGRIWPMGRKEQSHVWP